MQGAPIINLLILLGRLSVRGQQKARGNFAAAERLRPVHPAGEGIQGLRAGQLSEVHGTGHQNRKQRTETKHFEIGILRNNTR